MNKTIITIAVIIIVGAGSFYAGIKYNQSRPLGAAGDASTGDQSGFQQRQNQGRRGDRANNGGFSGGEIIAKDEKSITIKLRDNRTPDGQQAGGSKIIFLSDSTQVMKSVAGSLKDLSLGQNVTAMGSPNPDGSITAQTIQIRPASTTQPSR